MDLSNSLEEASAFFERGKLAEAAHLLAARIAAGQGCEGTFNLCGIIMLQVDNLGDAEKYFRASLQLNGKQAGTLNNLGATLRRANRNREAIEILQRSIFIAPDNAAAHHNIATAYHALGDVGAAAEELKTAVALDPSNPKIRLQLAEILRDTGQLGASFLQTRAAYMVKPEFRGLAGDFFLATRAMAHWTDADQHEAELINLITNDIPASTPFTFLSVKDDLKLQRRCAELWLSAVGAEARQKNIPSSRYDRLKIGYFSADFRNHPAMHLMIEMFENHDRSRFEIFAFSNCLDQDDKWRRRAKVAFDHFIDIYEMNDEEVLELARKLGVDIAVDLMGYTKGNRIRLFEKGVAPVQVSYMGFPGTLGTSFHDYIVADKILIPEESRRHYSEHVAYLPHTYMANCSRREIAAIPSKTQLGLPVDKFVFCCFNQVQKLKPEVFDQWACILSAVPESILWLWVGSSEPRANLIQEAQARGLNRDRIIFADTLPVEEHLARLVHADLFLDTRPYNAHTTAADALRMGLPLLTRIGEAFASRVAASLLTNLGLEELITHSDDEYVRKAIALAKDPSALAGVKAKLRTNLTTSPVFDSKLFTQNMEQLYLEMHRRAVAGEPPREIFLGKS